MKNILETILKPTFWSPPKMTKIF